MASEKKYTMQIVAEYREQGKDFVYKATSDTPISGAAMRIAYNGMGKEDVVLVEATIKKMLDALFAMSVVDVVYNNPDERVLAMLDAASGT